MPRPGPLEELPLDQFIPAAAASLKRAGDVLFSPAKRRILNDEGIYTPKPTHFSAILAGPSSPAKKLDFGSPKPQPSSSRRPRASSVDHDYCSQSSGSASLPPSSAPRETPPPPDPQSIHYPGFAVYFDVHSDIDEAPSITTSPNNKDVVKENIPPRRKTHKAATVPQDADSLSQLHSPPIKRRQSERLKKAKSTPATPRQFLMGGRAEPGSPTPRRLLYGQGATLPRRESTQRSLQAEVDADE